jgi:predicted ATPase
MDDKNNSRFHMTHYLSLLAILQARAGNMQDSLRALSRANEEIADTGERLWLSDVLRIGGELGVLFGVAGEDCERRFVEALAAARKQQAKSFELRAATSLARLWRDQGKRQHARDLLAPVYGWFTEGFDTLDLKEAKTLLDGLGS